MVICFAVKEWKKQWELDAVCGDMSPDGLLINMADINPFIRLHAIAACSHGLEV